MMMNLVQCGTIFNMNKIIKIIFFSLTIFLLADFTNAQTLPTGGNGANSSLFPLNVVCRVSPREVRTNTPVTWTAEATGGIGNYTYRWNGANMDQSTASTVTVSYGSIGTKNATVVVTSGTETAEADCSVVVNNNLNTSNNSGSSGGSSGSERNEFTAEAGPESDARRLTGETSATGEGDIAQMFEQLIGGVLECTIENILAQGFQGILGNLGQNIFGGTELGGQLGEASGVMNELLGGILQQPMVPTNPVPIVRPIKGLEAKEIGSSEAGGLFQMPSLDSIAYCLANSVIQYTSEGTARWLNTGFEGNPAFVEDYGQLFQDTRDIATEQYIQELYASQACGTVDQNIASDLAKQQQYRGIVTQQCNPNFESSQDLSNVDNFVNWFYPTNNPIYRNMKAQAELDERRANAQATAQFELETTDGFFNQRDATGEKIIVPAKIFVEEANKKLAVPIEKLGMLDEIGEILQELFKAVVTQVPGGILRKVLEEI